MNRRGWENKEENGELERDRMTLSPYQNSHGHEPRAHSDFLIDKSIFSSISVEVTKDVQARK